MNEPKVEINSTRKIRMVKPCGVLYTQGREYFLLSPYPIERDDWQGENCYRFVGVPRNGFDGHKYPYARHIVTNSFVVDYLVNTDEIRVEIPIWELDEYDLTELETLENE